MLFTRRRRCRIRRQEALGHPITPDPYRHSWIFRLLVAGVLGLSALGLIVFPGVSPWASPAGWAPYLAQEGQEEMEDQGRRKLSVVSWNTQGAISQQSLSDLLRWFDPDVVVLSETEGDQLAGELEKIPGQAESFQLFAETEDSYPRFPC